MNVDNGTINQHDDNHSPNIYNYNTTITAHLRRDLTPEMNKEATAADSEPQVTEATSILYHNNCFTYRDYIFHPSQKCKCLSASDLLSVLLLILLLIDHSYQSLDVDKHNPRGRIVPKSKTEFWLLCEGELRSFFKDTFAANALFLKPIEIAHELCHLFELCVTLDDDTPHDPKVPSVEDIMGIDGLKDLIVSSKFYAPSFVKKKWSKRLVVKQPHSSCHPVETKPEAHETKPEDYNSDTDFDNFEPHCWDNFPFEVHDKAKIPDVNEVRKEDEERLSEFSAAHELMQVFGSLLKCVNVVRHICLFVYAKLEKIKCPPVNNHVLPRLLYPEKVSPKCAVVHLHKLIYHCFFYFVGSL